MTVIALKHSLPFISRKRKHHIAVHLVTEKTLKTITKSLNAMQKAQIKAANFTAKAESSVALYNDKGVVTDILCGVHSPLEYYDGAHAYAAAVKAVSKSTLPQASFGFAGKVDDVALIGWGFGGYKFDALKSEKSEKAMLVVPANKARKAAEAHLNAVYTLRDLVNLPTNHLGPAQLEKAIKNAAKPFGAKVSVIKDKDLLKQNFPLVYTVGMAAASDRRPRLIELNWGKAKDPKLTLVGKGVCYDTGGLDIKPSAYMRYMKKDMGGAAHVIGLAMMVMAAGLPVRLRVLIPAVENAIDGNAFRSGDVIKSRKGITVENTNTDAEGRLILADTLTYASENDPDLIIDFATLTGSARAALGPDMPAVFANDAKMHDGLRKHSAAVQDPVWPMPLHQFYRKHIKSDVADQVNSAGLPGDLIYSALFLESFVGKKGTDRKDNPNWIHLDCNAWENVGRTGRPRGGADTGLRGIYEFVKKRYS